MEQEPWALAHDLPSANEAIYGFEFLGTWLLCQHRRFGRGNNP